MVKRESRFLTELKYSFLESKAFFHKISDSFHGGGLRFDAPKPFDAFGVYNGVPFAIEAKMIAGYKAFGKTSLRDCQIKGLQDWSDAGGKSFVFLNVKQKGDKETGTKRLNRLIIIEWSRIADSPRNFRKTELELFPYIDGKKKRFDVSHFLSAIEGWG